MPDEIDDILDSLEPVEQKKPKKRATSTTCQYVHQDGDWLVKVPPALDHLDEGDSAEVTLRDGDTKLVELLDLVKTSSRGTRWFNAGKMEDA